MGICLIKPDRDVDFYVLWSSETDSPCAYGTKGQLGLDLGLGPYLTQPLFSGKNWIEFADEFGSTARANYGSGPFGNWQQTVFYISETFGWPEVHSGYICRSDLKAYCEAEGKENVALANSLIVANEDEDYWDNEG